MRPLWGVAAPWNLGLGSEAEKKAQNKIKLEDVLGVLEGKGKNSNILKKVNDSVSIRKGKYGEYIFYKTESMSKPKFLKLKKDSLTKES